MMVEESLLTIGLFCWLFMKRRARERGAPGAARLRELARDRARRAARRAGGRRRAQRRSCWSGSESGRERQRAGQRLRAARLGLSRGAGGGCGSGGRFAGDGLAGPGLSPAAEALRSAGTAKEPAEQKVGPNFVRGPEQKWRSWRRTAAVVSLTERWQFPAEGWRKVGELRGWRRARDVPAHQSDEMRR